MSEVDNSAKCTLSVFLPKPPPTRYSLIFPYGSDSSAFPGDNYTAIIFGDDVKQSNRLFGVGALLPLANSTLAKLSLRYSLNFRSLYSKIPPITLKEMGDISEPFANFIGRIVDGFATDEIRKDGAEAVKSEVARGIMIADYAVEIGMTLMGSGPDFCVRQNWCIELGQLGIGAFVHLGAVQVTVSSKGEESRRWYFGRGGGGHLDLSPLRVFHKSTGWGITPFMVDASMTMVFTEKSDFRLLFFSANYLAKADYHF